jgi:teichuronic acid biosynthesis glycosyltransferase TuaC
LNDASNKQEPRLVVFSSLFPHPGQPNAGLFVRERMFRVARHLPLVVVAPTPWFPFQGLIRLFRPHYRPAAPYFEVQDGIEVYHPKFFAIPVLLRKLDGLSMALSSLWTMVKLRRRNRFNLIDAHFAYPDGYAATLLGKWFGVPVTITIRGTEVPLSKTNRRPLLIKALKQADRIFSVADSLKQHVQSLGVEADKIRVVGNGVDTSKFYLKDKADQRQKLCIPEDAKVLISVGGLVERKGFHRVIEQLPALRRRFPNLLYLIVGGESAEGNIRPQLEQQVADLGLHETVKFMGVVKPLDLKCYLSAADIFVLATRNEGWANVFLEAMACGLPVVTTDVGGNGEVVCREGLGIIVPFGDGEALATAIAKALSHPWDRKAITAYAKENSWDQRVEVLIEEFANLVSFFASKNINALYEHEDESTGK